jgi:hypothetical protein
MATVPAFCRTGHRCRLIFKSLCTHYSWNKIQPKNQLIQWIFGVRLFEKFLHQIFITQNISVATVIGPLTLSIVGIKKKCEISGAGCVSVFWWEESVPEDGDRASLWHNIWGYIHKFLDSVGNKINAYLQHYSCCPLQRVMAAKLTRLTHKIAIQLHLVAESCTIFSSLSKWSVQKLLDSPSYVSLILPIDNVKENSPVTISN